MNERSGLQIPSEIKKIIEDCIQKADLKGALNSLHTLPMFATQAVQLASRLSRTEKMSSTGLITMEVYDVQCTRLSNSILLLLSDKDDECFWKRSAFLPALPLNFIMRSDFYRLEEALLTQQQRFFGIFGQPGTGKTILMAALARSKNIQDEFGAEVYWVGFSNKIEDNLKDVGPVIYQKQLYWQFSNNDNQQLVIEDWQQGLIMLKTLAAKKLGNTKCLIIIDHPAGVYDLLEAIQVHDNAVFVIITNEVELLHAKGLAQQAIFQVEGLNDDEAQQLLSRWLEIPVDSFPGEAIKLISLLDNLPLAIAMVGANLKGTSDINTGLSDMIEIIKEGALKTQYPVDNYTWTALDNVFEWALRKLTEQERNQFCHLSAFPQTWGFDIELLAKVWPELSPGKIRLFVKKLLDKALLQTNSNQTYTLHNLMRLHLRTKMPSPLQSFQRAKDALHPSFPLLILAILWKDFDFITMTTNEENVNEEWDVFTPFIAAALTEQVNVIEFLLKKGALINGKGSISRTALTHAAYANNTYIASFLLDRGADINIQDEVGNTALIVASYKGNVETVELLINRGADLEIKDKFGVNALGNAIEIGNLGVVEVFLRRMTPEEKKTNFHFMVEEAIKSKEISLLKLMLEIDGDLNQFSLDDGFTLIQSALTFDNKAALQLLVEKGADVNLESSEGVTPLVLAIYLGNTPMVNALMELGAVIDLPSLNIIEQALATAENNEEHQRAQEIVNNLKLKLSNNQ